MFCAVFLATLENPFHTFRVSSDSIHLGCLEFKGKRKKRGDFQKKGEWWTTNKEFTMYWSRLWPRVATPRLSKAKSIKVPSSFQSQISFVLQAAGVNFVPVSRCKFLMAIIDFCKFGRNWRGILDLPWVCSIDFLGGERGPYPARLHWFGPA